MQLMTVIGFFFDNYREARNCVWTKKEKNIKKFFEQGTTRFIEFGGEISLNIADEGKLRIIDLMTDNHADNEIQKKMMSSFNMPENKNWPEYEEYIIARAQLDEEERHIEEVTCMDLSLDSPFFYRFFS